MIRLSTAVALALFAAQVADAANRFVDLGGPATGFFAITNFKNSATQNGIEGVDANGDFNPLHNGLPEYPNFEVPAGATNAGVFTAIIASPQSTSNDYSSLLSEVSSGALPTVNNQTITQPDAATLSAGRIDYDNSLVTGAGIEVVPVSELSFDFNTFEWDGTVTPSQTGDPRSNFSTAPVNISPFSPIQTPFNDGGGAGNAQLYYLVSISNVQGAGLTFENGSLISMDFTGDIDVDGVLAPFPFFGSLEYSGTLTASGLSYVFDVSGVDTAGPFRDATFIANRAGTATLVPEPAAAVLCGLAFAAAAPTRRRSTLGGT